MRRAIHEGLYDPSDPTPILFGSRCRDCAAVSFPAMTIGCEVCGAKEDALSHEKLDPVGTIHSVATVFAHSSRDSDISAPFTMAEVLLDSGPLIRVTLANLHDLTSIDRRVEASWHVVRINDGGDELIEPRFHVVSS